MGGNIRAENIFGKLSNGSCLQGTRWLGNGNREGFFTMGPFVSFRFCLAYIIYFLKSLQPVLEKS